jgi:hypothetical protein
MEPLYSKPSSLIRSSLAMQVNGAPELDAADEDVSARSL